MTNSINKVIFDQFLSLIEKLTHRSCCNYNECDFDYVENNKNRNLLTIIHFSCDKCGRVQEASVVVDKTNICLEDLISCRWVEYLESKARELIDEICPWNIRVVPDNPKRCKPHHPVWKPDPCKTTTYITHKNECEESSEECEVIIEKECECIKKCKRIPCVPKRQIIMKYENCEPARCCRNTVLVSDSSDHHSSDHHHSSDRDTSIDFYSAHN